MAFNSTEIIQEIHKEFAQMLDYVTNEAAYQATADQIERGLFKQLLQLGRQLLLLFFTLRSQQSSGATFTTAAGVSLPYRRDTKRGLCVHLRTGQFDPEHLASCKTPQTGGFRNAF